MRIVFKYILVLAFLLSLNLLFVMCAKSSSDPSKESAVSNAPSPSTSEFKWTPGNSTQINSDSAFCYSSFTTIFAFKTGNANSIEINLSSLSVGTYSISTATGNALVYVSNSSTLSAKSGSVNITAYANKKLSGNFSAALTGTSIANVNGQFTDIPVR